MVANIFRGEKRHTFSGPTSIPSRQPGLSFPSSVPVESYDVAIDIRDFERFEVEFRVFVENREAIYRNIPGAETWPFFEPSREKLLEYYLTLHALQLNPNSVYVDIASCLSLFPNYAAETTGATVVRQDLFYTPGVQFPRYARLLDPARGSICIPSIGSDGCAMPLSVNSVDAMALHCSFEHFEGDSDGRFVAAAMNILKPGGRLLIIPFYCGDAHQEIMKPEFAVGCQFHRYYSPATFAERVLKDRNDVVLEMRYYRDVRSLDKGFYCDYSVCVRKTL